MAPSSRVGPLMVDRIAGGRLGVIATMLLACVGCALDSRDLDALAVTEEDADATVRQMDASATAVIQDDGRASVRNDNREASDVLGGGEADASASQSRPASASDDGASTSERAADTTQEGGACTVKECDPGATLEQTQGCGDCGLGSQRRSGICSAACKWEWGSWGTCAENAACHPGATDNQSLGCPCAGTGPKSQTRTCNDSCAWGPWNDASSCDTKCCSMIVYCQTQQATNADVRAQYPGRGTWCRQAAVGAACSHEEALSRCMSLVSSQCGSVTPEFYMEYL